MNEAIVRLLGESADFAGLVDSSDASVSEVFERYERYREGRESWLVSRFICPINRLQELSKIGELRDLDQPFPVIALANHVKTRAAWEDVLESAANAMNEFDSSTSDWVEIDGLEISPPPLISTADALRDLGGFSEIEVYLDVPSDGQGHEVITAIADAEWAMARIVCDVPSDAHTLVLAQNIKESLSLEVPFQLSGKIRRAMTSSGDYGIVNVFSAVALCLSENLSRREMAAIISDGERTHWRFDDQCLSYRGWTADLESLDEARSLLVGMDCLSVEEVLEELATIGVSVPRGE